MKDIWNYIFFFGPVVINFLTLLWWRNSCESYFDFKFPTRGHVLFLTLVSFIPILGLVMVPVLLGFYFGNRATGDIILKKNKFNKYWFDVE